jgi:D-alanyl-D-alanine carboxypeptidase/D-alanyl-D-alanine-endopeptidase (penicillin-binding protein 4)
MALMARVVTGTVAAALVVTGGYAWADIHDFVPGILTIGPEPAPPAPFPTAPGAILGAAPTSVVSTLDPAAPTPGAAELQAAVDAVVADPVLGPSVGVVVSDALTGEVLASSTPGTPRVPASIQKLFTAAAALSTLDPDAVLTTTVTQAASGRLTLVGGGDMMLAAGAGDPAAVNGRAGLDDLAAQVAETLRLTGGTTVQLTLDDSLFTGSATGPWADDIPGLGFAAPVAAVAVDTGRLSAGEYAPRTDDPAMAAARTFAAALGQHGVTVEGEPTRGTSGAGDTVLGSVDSAPLGQVVEYFLHTSDNTITEVVGRLIAIEAGLPASFGGATQAVAQQLDRLGVDTEGLTLADASGLGDGSRASATTLSELLAVMSSPSHPELRTVMTGMPVAALDGTLSDRFVATDAAGLVRAKTGSLPGVTSLAGNLLTDDGRELLFVVMADQTPGPGQWDARAAIDGFVAALTDCGCR